MSSYSEEKSTRLNGSDPMDSAMFEPIEEATRYEVLSKLLDEKLLNITSYIKDDKDRGRIMMIKVQAIAYRELMAPLMLADPIIAKEAEVIMKLYLDQVDIYLQGMVIRKGWRPEQIAAILAADEKKRARMAGLFEDSQQKGITDLKKLQG